MHISNRLMRRLEEKVGGEIVQALLKIKFPYGDFLDFVDGFPTTISFLPNNAILKFDPSEVYGSELRKQKMNYVNLSSLLTSSGWDNKVISATSVKWNAAEEITFKFTDLASLYIRAEMGGIDSCMNAFNQELDEFYTPLGVKGVAFYSAGEFVARALLWENVVFSNAGCLPKSFMPVLDRVYTRCEKGNNQEILETIKANVEKKGDWVMKRNQNYYSLQNFLYRGVEFDSRATVKAPSKISYDSFIPYLDTFCGFEDSKTLVNTESTVFRARSTKGGLLGYNENEIEF